VQGLAPFLSDVRVFNSAQRNADIEHLQESWIRDVGEDESGCGIGHDDMLGVLTVTN
jgi:hypothetical protein